MPDTSEDSIALHRCHRTHHRNVVYSEGTITGNREETQSMQCNIMMHDHDMATCWCIELMQQQVILIEVEFKLHQIPTPNLFSKFNLIMFYPKQ